MDQEADFINEVLQEWAPTVIEVLHKGIEQRKLVVTDQLYRSLRWEIVKASAGMIASAKLHFDSAGRWKDMKTYRRGKIAPIESIMEEFVKTIGVSGFKYVPGYTSGKTVPTDSNALRRIAWGIAISMNKKKGTSAKKWYSKNFYGTINSLLEKLMASAQEKTIQSVKDSFNGK